MNGNCCGPVKIGPVGPVSPIQKDMLPGGSATSLGKAFTSGEGFVAPAMGANDTERSAAMKVEMKIRVDAFIEVNPFFLHAWGSIILVLCDLPLNRGTGA
jgi:hypothetical protein